MKKLGLLLLGLVPLLLFTSCEVMEALADSSYSSSSSSYSSSSSTSSSSISLKSGKYVSPNGGSGYVQLSGNSYTWYDSYGNYVNSGTVYRNGDSIKLGALSAGYVYDSEEFTTGSTRWCWADY